MTVEMLVIVGLAVACLILLGAFGFVILPNRREQRTYDALAGVTRPRGGVRLRRVPPEAPARHTRRGTSR